MKRRLWIFATVVATSGWSFVDAAPVMQDNTDDIKAQYEAKKEAVDESDAAALFELANWANDNGLRTDYKRMLRKVIKVDKNHKEAREALGYVFYEDRWVTQREKERLERKKEEEEMLAKGLRKWQGEWYPAAEVEMFEKGLFPVEIDGQTKWVSEREKNHIEAGHVLHNNLWVPAADKGKADEGMFLVGEEWVSKEDADAAHQKMDNPWEMDSDHTALLTTTWHDYGKYALQHSDLAIQRAHDVLGIERSADASKVPLFLVYEVDDFNRLGNQIQDNNDALMSSLPYGCFTFQDPNAARHVGVIQYTIVDPDNYQINNSMTYYLIRHAAAEAAVRAVEASEDMPRWFVTGIGAYCGRYWDPYVGERINELISWNVQNLQNDGGLVSLDTFFEPFNISRQTVLQSGLLMSYLVDGDLPDLVRQQWDTVRTKLSSETREDLAKEFLKLETIMAAEGAASFEAYVASFAG